MSLSDALRAAQQVLDEARLPWCVVGGLAVAAHAPARFTRDVDLVVAVPDDEQAEALVRLLHRGRDLPALLDDWIARSRAAEE